MEVEVIPTSVPHSKEEFADAVRVAAQFSKQIHHDVDDGIFTHEVSWPFVKFREFGVVDYAGIQQQIGVHLMVEEPQQIVPQFIDAGAKSITVHLETFRKPSDFVALSKEWRARGVEVGAALLIDTDLDVLRNVRDACDFVHLMTIASIGRQGIQFDQRGYERVKAVGSLFPDLLIAADGGINTENIGQLAKSGARRFYVGQALMRAEDPIGSYRSLRSAAEGSLQ